MIVPEFDGILTVKDSNGDLIAVIHRDEKSKHQVFYSVKEMGADDIKLLLEKSNEVKL